jgi:hypothetical protein
MSRKKKTDGVQDALIPDEITPLMLLDLATKDEYIEKYKNIDPITDALYDACDLSQHIFDAANAVNDLINYPVEARERVVKADIERSLLDPWRDLPTSGGDVDPDTGEIKED